MVTIQQAVLSVSKAEEELKLARGSALEREKEIQLAKSQSQLRLSRSTNIGTISSQISLAAAVGVGGVRREIKTRRRAARKEFKITRGKISKAREELIGFESQLGTRELEISKVSRQITAAKSEEKKRREIREQTIAAIDAISRGSLKPGASKLTTRLFDQAKAQTLKGATKIQEEFRALGIEPIPVFNVFGRLTGFKGEQLKPLAPSSADIRIDFERRGKGKIEQIGEIVFKSDRLDSKPSIVLEKDLSPSERLTVKSLRSAQSLFDIKGDFSFVSGKAAQKIGFLERIGVPKIVRQTLGVTPFEQIPGGERVFGRLGTTLQSALFLSLAGVRVPIPRGAFKIPLRRAKQPSFVESQQPFIFKGRPGIVSSFEITREISPPTFVGDISKGLLGGRIRPPKLEITTTPFKVLDELPVFTLTTRGGKVGKLDLIVGKTIPASVLDLGKASPIQRLLFQRFAESRTGLKIRTEDLPKVISRELEFDIGQLRAGKIGRVDIGRRPTQFDIFPIKETGRRIRRFETLSQFQRVLKTDQFEVFKGSTFFKETTKPFARARGITLELPGIVIRRRKPIVFGEEKGIESLKFSGVKRTSLDKTFAKQIQQQDLKLLIKPPPSPKPTKRTTLKIQRPSGVSGISSLLLGVSVGVSGRASLGTFDIDFARGRFQDREKQDFFQQPQAKPEERLDINGRIKQLGFITQLPLSIERQISIQQPSLKSGLEQRQFPKQREIGALKFRELLIQKRALRQTQKQIAKQKLAQKLIFKQKQIQKAPRSPFARPFRLARPARVTSPLILFELPRRVLPRAKKKKIKGRRLRPPIRPSLTGIITGGLGLPKSIKIGGVDIGIPPRQLRGFKV